MEIDKREVQMPAVLNKAVHKFENNVYAKRMYYILQSQMVKGFGLQLDLYNDYWLEIPTNLVGTQNFERLDKATNILQKATFKFIDAKLEYFNKVTPFPEVQYQKRWGYIKVKIAKGAIEYLAELSNGYYMAKLRSMLMVKGKYTQRWYELFSDKITLPQPITLDVDKIKTLLDIDEDTFKNNYIFLKRAIYEPIAELNEKTELFVKYEPMYGQKRPILGFDFEIITQNTKGEAESLKRIDEYYQNYLDSSGKEKNNLLNEILQHYGINPSIFNKIMFEKRIMDEVIKTHGLIKENKIKILKDKTKYMGGVISKLMKMHGIK